MEDSSAEETVNALLERLVSVRHEGTAKTIELTRRRLQTVQSQLVIPIFLA